MNEQTLMPNGDEQAPAMRSVPLPVPQRVDELFVCLRAVARFHGRTVTRESVLSGLPLVDHCLTPSLFERAAKRVDLASRIVEGKVEDLIDSMLPVILMLEEGRACVLLGWSADRSRMKLILPDMDVGIATLPVHEVMKRFSGYIIHVRPEFQFDERAPEMDHKASQKHWFWGAMRQNKAIYRDILVASILINVFALALPIFTMNVYDRVVPNAAVDTLWVLAAGIMIVLIGELILKVMRSQFMDLANKRIDIDVSATIMERVLGFRLEHRSASVGSLASTLRSFETVRDFLTSATLVAIVDLPFGLIFLIVIAWIAPWLLLPVLAGMVLMVAYAWRTQATMHELTETTYRAGALRNAALIESLAGLETIKSMSAEHVIQQKWESTAVFMAGVNTKLKLLATSVTNGSQLIQHIVGIVIIVIGVYLIGDKQMTMGGLIAAYMLSTRALAPMGQVTGLMTQYQGAKTAYEGLEKIMQNPVERPDGAQFVNKTGIAGKIEFRDVSFVYPGQEQQALRGVSFSIQPGEHVAILGKNGSGKSTILRLMLGLYQPKTGSIFMDDADLRQLDPTQVRRNTGYVHQDITLFYGSLRENVTMGRKLDDDQVLAALYMGGLKSYVDHHPKGLDLLVGERGESLSGGQRQGVALARAMADDPSILLMDEPTGAMDHSSEEDIKQRLKTYADNRTLVLITHRTALLELVDRIIVLDSGKLVADGPKAQVIEALRQGRIGKAS